MGVYVSCIHVYVCMYVCTYVHLNVFLYICFDIHLFSVMKVAPHGRVCMMDFLATALGDADLSGRIGTEALKPLADALVSCCEDSDLKVRDASALTLAALAPVVRGRGRPALEAHKVLMGLEQSLPRVYKKMQAAMEGTVSAANSSDSSTAVGVKASTGTRKPSTSAPKQDSSDAVASSGSSRFDDDAPPMAAPKGIRKPLSSTTSSSSSAPSTSAPKKPLGATTGSMAAKKATTSTTTSSMNEKEDDTVEDLALTLEDATEALAALDIEGWEGSFQVSSTYHYC
jgi:hypothetical protein